MAPPSSEHAGDARGGSAVQEPTALTTAAVSEAAVVATAASATATDDGSAGDAKQISLKVRTLDHTTYPISIGSNASVEQLKELVAVETGVVFARQRLIFRGKVLKNDQSIAAYSLEDGHTLHLVARAEGAFAGGQDVTNGGSSATNGSNRDNGGDSHGNGGGGRAGPAASGPLRNNDEPDPTIGGPNAPNHLLMGATISLPEGSGVSMPFLSSMIANIMTSAVHGSMVPGHIVISEADPNVGPGDGPGRASYAHFTTHPAAAATAGGSARARRTRAEPSLRSLRSSSRSRTPTAPSTAQTGLASLRSRSESVLESVRSNVENSDYDFTSLDEVQLDPSSDSDAAFLQSQLTQLEILLDHFRTRLHLLPVALRDLQHRSGNPTDRFQAPISVSAIVRTIDTLQSVGESADILARIARYHFIRHNPAFTGGASAQVGEGEPVTLSSLLSAGGTNVTVGTAPAAPPAATATGDSNTSRRSSSERRSSSHRRRHSSSRSDAARGSGETGRTGGGNALFSLLERMNESIRGVTAGLAGSNTEARASEPPAPALSSSAPVTAAAQAPSGQQGFVLDGSQISLAHLGAPLASVVFPISFADLNTNTSTWNFAELLNRLISEIPASTLFGVLSGDPVTIHQVMAQTGFALVSGVDVPPVSRATIRTWSHSLVNELREQLRSQGIPVAILSQIEASRQSSFVDQLIRPIEPFVPDLVDFFLRATSASRTAAFGTSSLDFLGTMSRQFVRHMRTYVGGDGERLQRVFQSLLEYFGLDSRLASFVVVNFLSWDGGDRRRAREEESAANAESGPEIKRQREE